MKLWYQSMSRSAAWGHYHPVLRRIIDGVKDPGTEVTVHGITQVGGVADQYRYLEYLESGEVMRNVVTAMEQGYDAFLIGNIADPGLRECREIADIPVLGLCETALHLASIMGASFSLVTLNEKFTARILENVDRAGLRGRLAGTARMQMDRILDLKEGFTDPEARARILAQFQQAAAETVERGAEVVIPAGGVAMALLADAGIHDAGRGAPILNGITSLIKMGEMAVRMNRLMGGRFTSKRLAYAPPGEDQIAEIRKHYGAVYPTVPGLTGGSTP
ncbi:aspartate/glutamate racemase family protein [Falsiroseomonas ponticola]|jgi:allantoin racemase|uniref:aspartate/glutamate racemase family protein n=1 Tax=Falsiroseomonas ponticola TaxID=2786951 RepID=UPI00193127EE|nr:aspartate/glutamate racemase family protein [Roseomonas ponticola]